MNVEVLGGVDREHLSQLWCPPRCATAVLFVLPNSVVEDNNMGIADTSIQGLLEQLVDGTKFETHATFSRVAPRYVYVVIRSLGDDDHLKAGLSAIRRLESQGFTLMEDSARHSPTKTEFVVAKPTHAAM